MVSISLTTISVVAQLVFTSAASSDLWLAQLSAGCSLLVVGISALKMSVDGYDVFKAVRRRITIAVQFVRSQHDSNAPVILVEQQRGTGGGGSDDGGEDVLMRSVSRNSSFYRNMRVESDEQLEASTSQIRNSFVSSSSSLGGRSEAAANRMPHRKVNVDDVENVFWDVGGGAIGTELTSPSLELT